MGIRKAEEVEKVCKGRRGEGRRRGGKENKQ